MVAVKPQDWSMIRGDTMSFNVEIEDLPQDLSSMIFTCRNVKKDEIIFQKTLGDGCMKISQGKYQVRVAPEDTENISAGIYNFDLEIQWGTDRYTPVWGSLKIINDETY